MSDSAETPTPPSEEPQEARGAPGSRDEGGPPGAGPADRPAGDPHEESTTVNPQGTAQDDMDALPAGDQGG
ncbi:MAG: hypothetical protein JWM48_569 [Mycobacterium sp.]|jgi:hypothetical protein|nr:hypothetical protein [Mycobacterium sp.]MCW2744019.1 hypothetical protein [Mycobacterium sp.]